MITVSPESPFFPEFPTEVDSDGFIRILLGDTYVVIQDPAFVYGESNPNTAFLYLSPCIEPEDFDQLTKSIHYYIQEANMNWPGFPIGVQCHASDPDDILLKALEDELCPHCLQLATIDTQGAM